MRKSMHVQRSAAVVLALLVIAPSARAYETVVGGLAGNCSRAAKAGHSDPSSIATCTAALSEPLNTHDLAGTYVNRGAMYLMDHQFEAAHADFQRALQIKPNMGEAMIGEGVYLINMEHWPEAEAAITHGLQAGTEEAEKGYYFRGLARWGQNDFKGAWLDFRKASELKPNWELPREQMAHFQVRSGT